MENPNLRAFDQSCEMIRHLQVMRFTAFTAFLVVSGGLFAVALKNFEQGDDLQEAFWIASIAGVVVAIVFFATEYRTLQRIVFYTDKVAVLGRLTGMDERAFEPPPHRKFWRAFSIIQWLLIYGGTAAIWIFMMIREWRFDQ